MIKEGIQNYDIKTIQKIVTTAGTAVIATATPAGMKRWVTFIQSFNDYGGENKLYLCSGASTAGASTNTKASAAAKSKLVQQTKDLVCIPPSGPAIPSKPLFAIAADKYLVAKTTRGDASLFVQYYDE